MMVDEYILRVTVHQSFSSTIASINLKPSPTLFAHAELQSDDTSRAEWLAFSIEELRKLLHDPVVVHGVLSDSETGTPYVSIICPKNATVKLFKSIAAVKSKLKVVLDNKAVQLQLQPSDLQAAVTRILLKGLTAAGWSALDTTTLIRCNALHMAAGELRTCEHISVQPLPGKDANDFIMRIAPGWARFRPVSIIHMLHERLGMASSNLSTCNLVQLSADLKCAQIACSVLPDCRPAVLVGAQLSVRNEEQMRANWLANTGLELPDDVPYYLDVKFSEEEDAPVVTVPSCFVWSASGLNVQPATKKNGIGPKVLHSLAGDLENSPFQFWADRQISIHHSMDSSEQQQKSSPWQTAKDLESQPASKDEQQLFKLGPAIPLEQLQAHMAPAAERQCAPELKKLLAAQTADRQPHQLHSQEKIQMLPAPVPVLMRRGPVQRIPQGTAKREGPSLPKVSQQMESAPASMSQQDAPEQTKTPPKVSAKPALAARKRPGYALTAQAPPKQLLKADAGPKQSTHAAPVLTARPTANPNTKTAAAPLPQSLKPQATPKAVKQAAAARANAAPTATPAAQEQAQQGNADKAGAAKAPRNRTKAADLDVGAVEAKIRAKHAEQQLEKLSIPEIKCFLMAKKLPVGGKKGDLLERLVKCLAESG